MTVRVDVEDRFHGKGAAKKCSYQKFLVRNTEKIINDMIRDSGLATIRDVGEMLNLEWMMKPENDIYGWTREDTPVKFYALHEGMYKCSYAMYPRVMNK